MMDSRSVLREDFGYIESMAYTLGKKESVWIFRLFDPQFVKLLSVDCLLLLFILIGLLELNYGFLGHIMCFMFPMCVLFATICYCYI